MNHPAHVERAVRQYLRLEQDRLARRRRPFKRVAWVLRVRLGRPITARYVSNLTKIDPKVRYRGARSERLAVKRHQLSLFGDPP